MKRGCKVDFLFLNIIGEKLMFDVSKVYNFLIARYTFTYTPKMFIIDGKEIIESIKNEVPDNLRQIAYKIVLYKISELIAQKNNYLALVSGESIAQKSSQTLKSLLFIEKQISITMLRPLLSFDKIEITDKARQIGTFSSSEKIKEYCDLSEGPVTTAPHELDMKKIPSFKKEIDKGVKNVLIKKGVLMIKDTKQINIPFNSKIVSIDIRPSTKQKNNPIKTDKQMSYSKALKNLDFFQKEKIYLIVCEFGVLSENLSFEIKKRGVKAIGLSVNAFKNYSKKN
ncbi:hypothetical protein CMO90_02750 [Candidatus Woesearchaeota archaeon]|nr:hypothetical protein [Candidatus Woesearchaeota archaeon]